MRSSLILLLVSLLLLSACGPAAAPPASETPPPAPTLTPPPTPTPAPDYPFYHLRIEYQTSSDWSSLDLLDSSNLLALRQSAVNGAPSLAAAGFERLDLTQPFETASNGAVVGMLVDLALAPAALDQPFDFLLQKGAIQSSQVRIYQVSGGQVSLLHEVDHQGYVPGNTDFNPLNFSIDLSPLKNSPPELVYRPGHADQKRLWAFYYPWYDLLDWSSDLLADRPQRPYNSNDPQAIERHIQQAQSAGIDGFIASWWGPGDPTDQILPVLLDSAARAGFDVAIYFETLTGDGPLGEQQIYDWMAYAIRTYRDHPAWYRLDGRPLMVVWASGEVPLTAWEQIFSRLRAEGLDAAFIAMGYRLDNLAVFDGLHEYGIFNLPDLPATLAATGRVVRHYGLLAGPGAGKIWAATVQPGYDDTRLPGREGLVQERQEGAFYRASFEAALRSDPDWILITSWNEWWENTHIEPSDLYGDSYLQITAEYARRWKETQP